MTDIKRVCVFASSCNYLEKSYYEAASEFGELLGKSGYDMVYGGSSLGLMWACAEKVKQNGAQLIGVMPERLHNMGVHTDECVDLFITPCMRSRKAKMDELSDAVVALAGGFGTLEELSEMIVQKQLGYNNKPIVILNTNGFYDKLIEFFDEIISQKFARDTAKKLYFVANTPKEAIEYIKNYQPENLAISKADIYTR
uniref:TIGR00730 family Rossman fold protein n=1 Tax=Candidatus Stercorousia sp. TaxID=3048886 RepID=UPI0040254CFF